MADLLLVRGGNRKVLDRHQPGARVVKERGRLNLFHILFQKGLNPFGGSGPLINWPDESSYIRKLAFADWDKVGG